MVPFCGIDVADYLRMVANSASHDGLKGHANERLSLAYACRDCTGGILVRAQVSYGAFVPADYWKRMMPQSSVIFFFILAGFLIFVTMKGELPQYLAVLRG